MRSEKNVMYCIISFADEAGEESGRITEVVESELRASSE